MNDNTIQITVDNQVVTLDVEFDCTINDLDEDMENVASTIAWYGSILAAAIEARDLADAEYRHWRAAYIEDQLAKNPKMAEWKTKAAMESNRRFLDHKRKIAAAQRLVVRLEKAFTALEHKSHNLRARGASARAEFAATGMHTRESPRGDDDRLSEEEKVRLARESMKRGKKDRR